MKNAVKTRRSFAMATAVGIAKIFMGKREVVTEDNAPLPKRFVLLGTHQGLSGPIVYHCYMPMFCIPWGTHEMLGNYRQRWKYLYHVFYRTKMHFNKFTSFVRATLLAAVSKFFYKGAGLIGTYRDGRQLGAIKRAVQSLEHNVPIVIFPEQSDDGYAEVPSDVHGGFVLLCKKFFHQHGEDLPVYPSYYCKKRRKIVIGKPLFVNSMFSNGHDTQSICMAVCDEVRRLYDIHGKDSIQVAVSQ